MLSCCKVSLRVDSICLETKNLLFFTGTFEFMKLTGVLIIESEDNSWLESLYVDEGLMLTLSSRW